jgi:lipopolysaccharide biosynthesis glycosyltransferase
MRVHITSASNEKYAPGLLLAIASSLYYLDDSVEVTVHILNGGISKKSIGILKKICTKYHSNCSLVLIDFNENIFSGTNIGPGGSFMAYARLMMGSLIQAEKVIYLDSDMIVLSDLLEVWNLNMEGKLIMGVPNYPPTLLKDDSPLPLTEIEKEYTYINTGFLVVDLVKWRANDIESEALKIAKNFRCEWFDQTIINYICRNNIVLLDERWNWQADSVLEYAQVIRGVIHCSSTRKPWLYLNITLRDRLWRFLYGRFIGNFLLFSLTRYNLKDTFSELKKLAIRKSSLLRKYYFYFLRLKNGAIPSNIVHFYSNVSELQKEDKAFVKFVLSTYSSCH